MKPTVKSVEVNISSDESPIQNNLKNDALSPLSLKCTLKYAIKKVQEHITGTLEMNGTHKLLV
jgi:hypothetical protein